MHKKIINPSDIGFRDFFTAQRNDYSCAVACMTSISKIMGIISDYEEWEKLLKPNVDVGTAQKTLIDSAYKIGKYNVGCGIYNNGLAIANTTTQPDNDGHYIVLLHQTNNDLVYYCPYDDKIYQDKKYDILWKSDQENNHEWAITFGNLTCLEMIISKLDL